MAECSLAQLLIPGAKVTLVHKGAGFEEVASLIRSGMIEVQGFKIVVLLVRRADVLNRSRPVVPQLDQLLQAVQQVDSAIILLVASPIPYPTDGPDVVRKLYRTTAMLKAYCHGKPTVDYLRATQDFVELETINSDYVTPQGITKPGLGIIKKLTLAKINCSKLRQRYQALKSMQKVSF